MSRALEGPKPPEVVSGYVICGAEAKGHLCILELDCEHMPPHECRCGQKWAGDDGTYTNWNDDFMFTSVPPDDDATDATKYATMTYVTFDTEPFEWSQFRRDIGFGPPTYGDTFRGIVD